MHDMIHYCIVKILKYILLLQHEQWNTNYMVYHLSTIAFSKQTTRYFNKTLPHLHTYTNQFEEVKVIIYLDI